jgi:predicted RNase H-like HicB family nuclease
MSEEKVGEANARPMLAGDYMALPYSRCFVPEEAGDFSAYVREFPGCYSQGDTIEEAYECLEDAMCNWLEASIDLGHSIPLPLQHWHVASREDVALKALVAWREAKEALLVAVGGGDPESEETPNWVAGCSAALVRLSKAEDDLLAAADALTEGEKTDI